MIHFHMKVLRIQILSRKYERKNNTHIEDIGKKRLKRYRNLRNVGRCAKFRDWRSLGRPTSRALTFSSIFSTYRSSTNLFFDTLEKYAVRWTDSVWNVTLYCELEESEVRMVL